MTASTPAHGRPSAVGRPAIPPPPAASTTARRRAACGRRRSRDAERVAATARPGGSRGRRPRRPPAPLGGELARPRSASKNGPIGLVGCANAGSAGSTVTWVTTATAAAGAAAAASIARDQDAAELALRHRAERCSGCAGTRRGRAVLLDGQVADLRAVAVHDGDPPAGAAQVGERRRPSRRRWPRSPSALPRWSGRGQRVAADRHDGVRTWRVMDRPCGRRAGTAGQPSHRIGTTCSS